MKKFIFLFLPFLLFLAGAFVSCEEVEEAGKYDNWQPRNEAFIDSIKALVGTNYVETGEAADRMAVGQMFAIQTTASSNMGIQYVYCKKITKKTEGLRPLFTQSVSTFYYGTVITGERFDGNFEGYKATDRGELDPLKKAPTDTNSPTSFAVNRVITGWSWALQYMRKGERWMLYIPYQSGYGASASGGIPAYSALTFDVELVDII